MSIIEMFQKEERLAYSDYKDTQLQIGRYNNQSSPVTTYKLQAGVLVQQPVHVTERTQIAYA